MKRLSSFGAVTVILAGTVVAACDMTEMSTAASPAFDAGVSGNQVAPDEGDAGQGPESATPPDMPPPSTTHPLAASTLAPNLQAMGINLHDLPALYEIKQDKDKLHAVMQSFTKALGVPCGTCHMEKDNDAGLDFAAETPEKNVAKAMWDRFVGGLATVDGTPLYCDSCHQGSLKFLDRSNDGALGVWMRENFVHKLKRDDGQDHNCSTCHGSPFDPHFLTGWRDGEE